MKIKKMDNSVENANNADNEIDHVCELNINMKDCVK